MHTILFAMARFAALVSAYVSAWTDYVSLGATHVLVARVVFEPDVVDETILPLLQDFYDARTEETIGLLSPREAADLRQELRDYRAVHLNTAPRIVEHKLKFD